MNLSPRFLWLALAACPSLLCAADDPVRPGQQGPLAPEESLKRIQLDGPYEAQLVAAEPLVHDPVEVCWDAQGRLFVADMRDYPLGPTEAGAPPLSSIQQLVDDDGDGRMDRAIPFAEQLDFVQGIVPYRDGLIATTRTQILFLKDTDGDGKADEIKPLIEGFNPTHSQLQVSSPRWGPDGWLYFNNGLDSKEIYPADAPEKKTKVARLNFKWDPKTGAIEPVSAFGQFGAAFDSSGHYFTCSNRNPVMLSVMPYADVVQNRFATIEKGYEDVAPSGADSRVYPLQITHTTSDAHAGTNTACSGVGVYTDVLMPALRDNVFVPDPTGQLITRYKMVRAGSSLQAVRQGNRTEFFRSSDEWCRPVNFSTGPDGAIYVCDIYRQYIDHARFFPEEFVKTHNLRAGENEGRIWRIVPTGTKILPKVEPAPADLSGIAKWGSRTVSTWRISTAARLHLEQTGEQTTTRSFVDEREALPAKLTAYYDELTVEARPEPIRSVFLRRATPEVQIPLRVSALTKYPEDVWITRAVLSASTKTAGKVLHAVLRDRAFYEPYSAAKSDTIRLLAAAAAGAAIEGDLEETFAPLQENASAEAWWAPALLRGLAEGLPRSEGRAGVRSLAELMNKPPERWKAQAEVVRAQMAKIEAAALAPTVDVATRVAALPLLALRGLDAATPALKLALAPGQAPELHAAAMEVLRRVGPVKAEALVYEVLPQAGPALNRDLVALLCAHPQTALALFQRMERGELPKAWVEVETRWRWQQDKGALGALAKKLFGEASSDRAAVVAKYLPAATQPGNAQQGRELFTAVCAVCHRYGDAGAEVGPTLSDVKAKPPEALVSDIMDPNRMFEARWSAQQITLKDGRALAGLISAETADNVTVTMMGGAKETVPRSAIAELKSLDRSLMPVGLEGAISPAQLSDLLAFLRGR